MKAAYCQMKVLDLASVSPSCFARRLDDDDSRQVRCLRRRFIDFPSPDGYARNRRAFYCPNKITLNLIRFSETPLAIKRRSYLHRSLV